MIYSFYFSFFPPNQVDNLCKIILLKRNVSKDNKNMQFTDIEHK